MVFEFLFVGVSRSEHAFPCFVRHAESRTVHPTARIEFYEPKSIYLGCTSKYTSSCYSPVVAAEAAFFASVCQPNFSTRNITRKSHVNKIEAEELKAANFPKCSLR